LALGNLHAIRGMLDKHPHRILLTTDSPRELAARTLDVEEVHGVRFPLPQQLEIQTNDLNAVHSVLPSLITSSGLRVSSIQNPDDNLESLLAYLMEGRA